MNPFVPAVILGRRVSNAKTYYGIPREQTSVRRRNCRPGRSPTFVGVVTMAAAAWLLAISPCAALECPAPQPANAPDAIKETPTQINELAEILASHDVSNLIPAFVRLLRTRHPNAAAGELVNYLVTAYCPVVDRMGISEAEKKTQLESFASQVTQAAF